MSSVSGQKIAKKLSQQLSKETNAIKTLLQEHNACSNESCDEMTLSDAMVIATKLKQVGLATPTGISSGKKREVIDAYLLMCRSSEEISMLEKEMHSIFHYYEKRENVITYQLGLPCLNQFERGKKALLHILLKQNNELLMQTRQVCDLSNHQLQVV